LICPSFLLGRSIRRWPLNGVIRGLGNTFVAKYDKFKEEQSELDDRLVKGTTIVLNIPSNMRIEHNDEC
jgi:hypothetical protein